MREAVPSHRSPELTIANRRVYTYLLCLYNEAGQPGRVGSVQGMSGGISRSSGRTIQAVVLATLA